MKTKAESKAAPRKWSATVQTASTYPPKGLFTKSAAVIARALATKRVSPKGPSSGMRMLTFYINRAGKNLSKTDRARLERAKDELRDLFHRERKAA